MENFSLYLLSDYKKAEDLLDYLDYENNYQADNYYFETVMGLDSILDRIEE